MGSSFDDEPRQDGPTRRSSGQRFMGRNLRRRIAARNRFPAPTTARHIMPSSCGKSGRTSGLRRVELRVVARISASTSATSLNALPRHESCTHLARSGATNSCRPTLPAPASRRDFHKILTTRSATKYAAPTVRSTTDGAALTTNIATKESDIDCRFTSGNKRWATGGTHRTIFDTIDLAKHA